MSTKLTPPPDRFSVRRIGEPDHLAPAVSLPLPSETDRTSDAPLLPGEPDSMPAEPVEQPAHASRREP
jgi:hypothetical protein